MNIAHKKQFGTIALAFFLLTLTIISSTLFWLNRTNESSATMAGWDAGNIMSDYVMTNKNSMTESDIYWFLKSKNHCNDRSQNRINYMNNNPSMQYSFRDGHFVCMADEIFDGESSSHIIWQAAQDYNINPQVLIVLLEKEQGLVTDTWPNWNYQYKSATGYGCPDGAACSAQYYGFKNQVRNAANFFRAYQNNSPGWYKPYWVGAYAIKFHPSNTACGSSVVNIANRATASLYSYTPYQPNWAALNANYGTGDSCSSYGNRNFYNLFTDWFGSTRDAGWQNMSDPRIMAVETPTLKIDPFTGNLDDNWLTHRQQIVFTQKTDVYRDNEKIACLRTKTDQIYGINRCVLMPRLSEFAPTYKEITSLSEKTRTTSQFTCKVALKTIDAVCNEVSLSPATIVNFAATTEIMGSEYYITQHDWGLGKRTRGILANRIHQSNRYEAIDTTYMITTANTHKYIPGMKDLHTAIDINSLISFSDKIVASDGKVLYRTTHDNKNNYDLAIPAEHLSKDIFTDFLAPRDMAVARKTTSRNIATNEVCATVDPGTHLYMSTKTTVKGAVYYRTATMTATHSLCAIPANDMREL